VKEVLRDVSSADGLLMMVKRIKDEQYDGHYFTFAKEGRFKEYYSDDDSLMMLGPQSHSELLMNLPSTSVTYNEMLARHGWNCAKANQNLASFLVIFCPSL